MAKNKKGRRFKPIGSKVKRTMQERERKGGGGKFKSDKEIKYFKPKKGTNLIDIIPFIVSSKTNPHQDVGQLWWHKTIFVHYNVGSEDRSYICPLKTANKPCPICEYRVQLEREGADEDTIKALKPKERVIYNVIDQDKPNEGVQLFEYSDFLFHQVLEEEVQADAEGAVECFPDLYGGMTLKVRFKEDSFGGVKFLKASRIDFIERDDLDESILDKVHDLDMVPVILPYEKLEKLFLDLTPGDAKEEDEDEDEGNEEDDEGSDEGDGDNGQEDDTGNEGDEGDDDDGDGDDDGGEEEPEEEEPEEEEPEEEEPEDKPKTPKRGVKPTSKKPERKPKPSKKDKGGFPCPAEGGTFGVDFETLPECEDCEVWAECQEKNAEG